MADVASRCDEFGRGAHRLDPSKPILTSLMADTTTAATSPATEGCGRIEWVKDGLTALRRPSKTLDVPRMGLIHCVLGVEHATCDTST